jgi:hypothetical protein
VEHEDVFQDIKNIFATSSEATYIKEKISISLRFLNCQLVLYQIHYTAPHSKRHLPIF